MISSTIRDLLLLVFVGSAVALPLNAERRDPAKDIGIGITFKYPFKAAEGAVDGTADTAAAEKRSNDAITFKYPIFKVAEGATDGAVEKRATDANAISFKYPFVAADGAVEKRNTDGNAITFKYPFVAADGAVEKREPKSAYADVIAAADPRDILG
ncbi:hypothetical protein O1611_g2452 [Lasiodiplodia mahajangana]|uniref:Uncharacterized protein n=1 Tax=Lasiodiplodia mahajangana TaxID=1108764 RepID=A0ACC2JUL7_9PEZI|nr:hypothetical protein O1611_g2452 [Lasiodiplodia mahajangana]